MNNVNVVKDQPSAEALGDLGSSIGESGDEIRAAAGAAVPAMLSAPAGMVSSGGAEKLIDALRNLDAGSLARLRTDAAQGDGGKLRDQGADILGLLLGGKPCEFAAS